MPTYFSPQGNPEVWDEKPQGYVTPEEWTAAHPPKPPTPEETKEVERRRVISEIEQREAWGHRAAQAVAAGTADEKDLAMLQCREEEMAGLRAELAGLEGGHA